MKKYVIIIASALLLLGCNENRRMTSRWLMDDVGRSTMDDGRRLRADSFQISKMTLYHHVLINHK